MIFGRLMIFITHNQISFALRSFDGRNESVIIIIVEVFFIIENKWN